MTLAERKLLRAFRALNETRQSSLLDYAEFLIGRDALPDEPSVPTQPLDIPRPEMESVVKAIKRLKATYPMLDPGKLLHETSALMSQHLMQKRPAAEVIDELEALFLKQYETQAQAD